MFEELRQWQVDYSGRNGRGPTHNLFAPCPIRDHHEVGRDVLVRLGAQPIHADAAAALGDPEYARRMIAYGREVRALLDPIWQ